MSRPVVLLDCDGVLADFVSATLDLVHTLGGRRHASDEVRTWEIFDSIGTPELRERVYDRMNREGFCRDVIRPYPGAVEAIADLREHADVYVVTAPFRTATWMSERLAWLGHHFALPADHVVFTERKQLVRGDVFVDDKPDHVRRWDAGRRACTGRAFLWDQAYNREADLPRLRSWAELRAAIED